MEPAPPSPEQIKEGDAYLFSNNFNFSGLDKASFGSPGISRKKVVI